MSMRVCASSSPQIMSTAKVERKKDKDSSPSVDAMAVADSLLQDERLLDTALQEARADQKQDVKQSMLDMLDETECTGIIASAPVALPTQQQACTAALQCLAKAHLPHRRLADGTKYF
eukprot:gene718-2512_t